MEVPPAIFKFVLFYSNLRCVYALLLVLVTCGGCVAGFMFKPGDDRFCYNVYLSMISPRIADSDVLK